MTLMVMINDFVIQAVKPQEFVTAIAVRRFWYKQHKCLVIEHFEGMLKQSLLSDSLFQQL